MINPEAYIGKLKGKKKEITRRYYDGENSRRIIDETGYDRAYVWKTISDLKREGMRPRISPDDNLGRKTDHGIVGRNEAKANTPEGHPITPVHLDGANVTFEEIEPKAFELFIKGKGRVDVVISLQIPADWAEKMHANFLRLQDFDDKHLKLKAEYEDLEKKLPIIRSEVNGLNSQREKLVIEVKRLTFLKQSEENPGSSIEGTYWIYRQLIRDLETKPVYESFQKVFHDSSRMVLQTTRVGEFALLATIYSIRKVPDSESLLKVNSSFIGRTSSIHALFATIPRINLAMRVASEITEFYSKWMLEEYMKGTRVPVIQDVSVAS